MQKKFLTLTVMAVAAVSTLFQSCKDKDNGGGGTNNTPSTTLTGKITANQTLTADKIWTLSGRVIIASGTTLTIEPGTIIKAEGGVGENASALIIARGAKIMAEGTATKPIIFTSVADDIKIGTTAGSNLSPSTIRGLWGGVIVLGAAPISPKTGTTAQIEGIPADVTEGNYGGTNVADNSGVMKFVSIRHGGALIGSGNEINGLTLGGVGNATVIENIEIAGNTDDGIEFFGGSVNVKNAIVLYSGDDSYDVDQSYSGTIDNVIAIAGADTDHTLEIDGPEGSENNGGLFTLKNGVFMGAATGEFADFRDGAQGTVTNCHFFNYDATADIELDDDKTSQNFKDGKLILTNNSFNATVTIDKIATDKSTSKVSGLATEFIKTNTIGTTKPAGFSKSAFATWTLASHLDLLKDF